MYSVSENGPLHDALQALTNQSPPEFVKGAYFSKDLFEYQIEDLQNWCSINANPSWATGLSMIEAAEIIVKRAIENANIKVK